MRTLTLLFLFIVSISAEGQQWKSLNDAGMEYYRKGQYAEAEQFFIDAADASARAGGLRSKEYTTSLTNAAYAQQMRADFASARRNFRIVLNLTESLFGGNHIENVEAAINLANVFLPAGLYDSCEIALLQARSLVETAIRENSAHYRESIDRFYGASISIRNSLASLYYKKGLTPEAIGLMTQQRADIRQAYPDDYHTLPIYQNTVNNLATYYMDVGDMANARVVVKEQANISSLHPERKLDYLQALNNLGSIYRLTAQEDSAAMVWTKAMTLIDSGLFAGSDLHISILNNVGEMAVGREDYDHALLLLQRSLDLQNGRAAVNPRIYQTTLLNLCEALFWMGNLKDADKQYQQLCRMLVDEVIHNFTYLSEKEKIAFYRSNLSILEYYKYFTFDVAGAYQPEEKVGRYLSPDALASLFDVLLVTKGLILHPGYRLRSSIMHSNDSVMRTAYARWESNKNYYATLARSENPDRSKLSALLRETEEIEKWLRINSSDFRRGFVIESRTWRDIQKELKPGEAVVEMVRLVDGLVYGALVLTSETTGGPVFAMVKSTKSRHLEKQFYLQYANSVAHNLTDTISFDVYWKPVLEKIHQHERKGFPTKRIHFSPDGIYNRINLNTLWNVESKRYHVDEMEINTVTNLKEILPANDPAQKLKGVSVLLGRPHYYSSGQSTARDLSDLAGTEEEVDQINVLLTSDGWSTALLKGADAQEASVKRLRNPYVLHLATHGFSSNGTGTGMSPADNLLNSGIILAGAGDRSALHGEDGVLTAFEMANLVLDATRLVVLSACETGLGEFHTGEGIYGLQAALRSAGARSVIMSLWKVDDKATQELMTSFYRHWLSDPANMRGAFRIAQQELRRKFPAPHYWGAFIMTGK